MPRPLDTITLDAAARIYAAHLSLPSRFSRGDARRAVAGREWALQSFYNATFKDEFNYLRGVIGDELGKRVRAEFDAEGKKRFTPRDDKVFQRLLAEHLAITPAGEHIEGRIGRVVVGHRLVGERITRHGTAPAWWPVYAGEDDERGRGHVRMPGRPGPSAGSGGADPLPPPGTLFWTETGHLGVDVAMALNTNVSIAFAQAGVNAALDLLDEGTGAGVIKGYTGAQPVDPNAAATGTLLFTLVLTDPAFGNAADGAPDAVATASAITDDSSADATGTLGYNRASSSNDGAAALNDHIDGSAATSGADFNFNTVSIVSGAVVSMTSWTVTFPQGPTAT